MKRRNCKNIKLSGLTMLEMIISLAIIAVLFAVMLPQFRNIENSWASKQTTAEAIQNGRILTARLNRSLAKAVRITAVSDPSETDGYVEFEGNDGTTYRYDIGPDNYVRYGPVGNLSEIGGPVSQLQFTCYDVYDLDTPTTTVGDIRSVNVQITLTNSGPGQDQTFTTQAYLRTNSQGLIGHWKLDETSGLTAADSSGRGNDGTLTNMAGDEWTTGIIDGALEFAGDGDYVEDADGEDYINGLTAFTLSLWIKSDLTGTDKGFIVAKYSTGEDNVFGLRYDAIGNDGGGTDVIKACITVSGIERQLESSSNVQTTNWQHLALTWSNGNQLALYIDGIIDSPTYNQSAVTGSISGSDTLLIGRGAKLNSTDTWDGLIDDVRIYNRVLTAEEIAALANILRYREFTEKKRSSFGSSLTIDTPSGTSEQDLLVAAVVTDWWTISSLAPPLGEGWTEINVDHYLNNVTLGVWWKLADALESPTHQFTWTGWLQAYGWIMRFTGHDPTTPINTSSDTGGNSISPTSPSVTTTVSNCLILRIGGFDDDDVTVDSPGLSGHTAITMDESSSGSSTCSGGAGYIQQPSIGASGTATFDLTMSEQYRTVTIAIAPDPSIGDEILP